MGSQLNEPALTDEERANLPRVRKRKMQLLDEIEQIKNEMREVEAELESLYYVDESSKTRIKLMSTGRKKFNQDPWKGIDYLAERGLLSRDSKSVGQWMFKGEGISKASIGEVLGSNDPFSLSILHDFTFCHDFTDSFLLDALRSYLWSFRLPGESQKIDRILVAFSERYVDNNPGLFKDANACFMTAYMAVMLNTILHNTNIKEKPTFASWCKQNEDWINDGNTSVETMQAIFDSLKSDEFKIPLDETGVISDILLHAEREGWLYKQSSSQFISGPLSWKRRWFVLSETCLYYFEQTTDKEPRGIIPLQNVGIRKVEATSRPHMFEIYSLSDERIKACKTEQNGKMVEGRHSVYRMCAANAEDLRSWINAISGAMTQHPLRPKSTH